MPTVTLTAVSTASPILTDSATRFCDGLAQAHAATPDCQTYCDADYGFAFDYPLTWRITYLTGFPDTSDTPDISTILVRRAQRFEANNLTNYIRVDTYRMPNGNTLPKQVEQIWGYPSRMIPDQPYEFRLGGLPADALIIRYHQDYSAVYLFFQHGLYYSVMHVKAISHIGLDTNWQIARSLQDPGAGLEENVIPQDLIEDSHKLLP